MVSLSFVGEGDNGGDKQKVASAEATFCSGMFPWIRILVNITL